jgi:predicted Zn-dependent protease
MKDLAQYAMEAALFEGASYADIRIINDKSEDIVTKNGHIGELHFPNGRVWCQGSL